MILSQKALQDLARYDWPGNVRELENIIERAVILNAGPVIEPEDLDLNLDEMLGTEEIDMNKFSGESSLRSEIQRQEQKNLKDVMIKAGGNISKAARLLDIPRSTLFRRLRKHGLI